VKIEEKRRKKKEIVKIELESRDKQEIFNMATKTNENDLLKYFFYYYFLNRIENNKKIYTLETICYVFWFSFNFND